MPPPLLLAALLIVLISAAYAVGTAPFPFSFHRHDAKFDRVSEEDLLIAREQAREMFYHGYNNYMNHAYPLDELDPIHCSGRGHDHDSPENININDVLGDYSLSLVESLTTLVGVG